MEQQKPNYELYRKSTLGVSLTESLDEMISHRELTDDQALKILALFDKSMNYALDTQVRTKISFKGHLHTYRFCDNVWTFIIEDATFKGLPDSDNVSVDKVKIVACDAKAGRTK